VNTVEFGADHGLVTLCVTRDRVQMPHRIQLRVTRQLHVYVVILCASVMNKLRRAHRANLWYTEESAEGLIIH